MEKRKKRKERLGVKQLLMANLLALFTLLFVIVLALWALGLLGSVLAFIF